MAYSKVTKPQRLFSQQYEENKLFRCLVIQQQILLYLLPDGRGMDRLWLRQLSSFRIFEIQTYHPLQGPLVLYRAQTMPFVMFPVREPFLCVFYGPLEKHIHDVDIVSLSQTQRQMIIYVWTFTIIITHDSSPI